VDTAILSNLQIQEKFRVMNPFSSVELTKMSEYGKGIFEEWINMLILGDNLLVLKTLVDDKTICGKVNLIYIDPPFATNQTFTKNGDRTATISRSVNDEIAYHDKVTGRKYLEFLRARLIFMREILSQEGSIYIHIDLKMGHYVKVVMDEVFGRDRYINDITRNKCSPKNFTRKGYGNIKDMILFYSKSKDFIWNEPRQTIDEADIERLFPKIDKDGRRYTTTPLHAPGETQNGCTGREWKGLKPPVGRHWRSSPEKLTRLDREGLIEWSDSGNPRKIIYAEEKKEKGKKMQDIWEFKDPPYPVYPTEKNLEMLKMIVNASSNSGDIVLDSFCGSGSTLLAAELLGRGWIGIDNSKMAISTAEKRLKEYGNISHFMVLQEKELKK